MRSFKNLFAALLAVLLLAVSAPAALAVSDASVEAGKTATLTFYFDSVYELSGAIAIVDPAGIVAEHSVRVVDAGDTTVTVVGDRVWADAGNEPTSNNITVEVQLVTNAQAQPGTRCTVSFSGAYGDAKGEAGNRHDVYQSALVTVAQPAPAQTQEPAAPVQPETPAQPAAPVVTKPTVNYSQLEQQIIVANGLDPADYTAETGDAMKQALADAKAVRKSKSQSKVDEAASALKTAIAGLVKMDYSALSQALTDAGSFSQTDGLVDLWQDLNDAVVVGKALTASQDQNAVDSAAAQISNILRDIRKELDVLETPKVVEVEVPVEVLPTDDYCNVARHHVWPNVAIISIAVNLLLIALIAVYTFKKQTYNNDNTPLVDYDIGDDV